MKKYTPCTNIPLFSYQKLEQKTKEVIIVAVSTALEHGH